MSDGNMTHELDITEYNRLTTMLICIPTWCTQIFQKQFCNSAYYIGLDSYSLQTHTYFCVSSKSCRSVMHTNLLQDWLDVQRIHLPVDFQGLKKKIF
jgi:hypothetical protein